MALSEDTDYVKAMRNVQSAIDRTVTAMAFTSDPKVLKKLSTSLERLAIGKTTLWELSEANAPEHDGESECVQCPNPAIFGCGCSTCTARSRFFSYMASLTT